MSDSTLWRLRYLDGLRGVAIIQVVMSTYLAAFHPQLQPTPLFQHDSPGAVVIAMLADGYSGICMFLAVSGFALTWACGGNHASVPRLVAGRAVRLAIPAVAGILLGAAVVLALPGTPQAASVLTGSPLLAALFPVGPTPALVARDVATAFLTGYNGSSAAADTIAWYSNALFPVGNTLHLSFPLMESFNPALWSLCLQTLGSLITVILIAARRMGPLLWGALFVAAAACLALTPLAAMLVGHLVARVRLTRDPTASLALMVPVLFVGAYLCLVPFGPFSPALSEICASPWLSLTACADTGHLLKIAGVSVIFCACTVTPRLQSILGDGPLAGLGRLSLPIYLSHVPVLGGICAAVLLGSNMPAGPDRATLIAITALITLSIATAMLRPIDGLAKLVGHRIALGRSSRERPVPAGSRGRRIAPAAGTSGQRSNSRL